MKVIVIIPARGGSKEIPKKNIKQLNGKPLIFYTIKEALKVNKIDRIIISTDSDEIAQVAKNYGAEVIMRPINIALDETPTEPAIIHTLNWLKENENYIADIVVLLQPTSPLRKHYHIENALNLFFEENYDSLLSVAPFKGFVWKSKPSTHSLNYNYKNRPRRQDKEPEFIENGAIYITKSKLMLKESNRLGGKIGLYVMPSISSLEIDTEEDFRLCEIISGEFNENKI